MPAAAASTIRHQPGTATLMQKCGMTLWTQPAVMTACHLHKVLWSASSDAHPQSQWHKLVAVGQPQIASCVEALRQHAATTRKMCCMACSHTHAQHVWRKLVPNTKAGIAKTLRGTAAQAFQLGAKHWNLSSPRPCTPKSDCCWPVHMAAVPMRHRHRAGSNLNTRHAYNSSTLYSRDASSPSPVQDR